MRKKNDDRDFYESDPDVFLMMAFQNGERAAFENLMRKYYKRIFNFIYRLTGIRESAEDLAQDVFLKVYQSASQYRPRAKFQTWLYTIAKNTALNELRRVKRPVLSMDSQIVSDHGGTIERQFSDAEAPLPSDGMLSRERQKAVRDAIGTLPDHQRTAVLLFRFERMSYEQISQTMGMSVSAVKSLLSRARQGLRQRLKTFVDG